MRARASADSGTPISRGTDCKGGEAVALAHVGPERHELPSVAQVAPPTHEVPSIVGAVIAPGALDVTGNTSSTVPIAAGEAIA